MGSWRRTVSNDQTSNFFGIRAVLCFDYFSDAFIMNNSVLTFKVEKIMTR